MRHILYFISLLFLMSTALAVEKPRVAIYLTGDDPINEIISNRLMSTIINSGKYRPVERSAAFLAAISKEHSFERNGTVDDDEIARIGKQFGIHYVCVVSVLDVWQTEKYITAHIIDVNSAEVIGSCSSNGTITSPDALMPVLDDLSLKLFNILYDYKKKESGAVGKVAVYVTRTGNRDVDIILGDQLVSAFSKNENFIAVERSDAFLKQLSKETGYQQSGAVDDNEVIVKLGKRFGVKFVCVAKTISWGGSYFINSRLVNVETAEVMRNYNAENRVMNNAHEVISVAYEIAEHLTRNASTTIVGSDNDEIFVNVEEYAEFPGGKEALNRFLDDNLKYPKEAKENNFTGIVLVKFIVERDGSITRPTIVRNVPGGCGEEVLRVISIMPLWNPAKQGGMPVRNEFFLPVSFELH